MVLTVVIRKALRFGERYGGAGPGRNGFSHCAGKGAAFGMKIALWVVGCACGQNRMDIFVMMESGAVGCDHDFSGGFAVA